MQRWAFFFFSRPLSPIGRFLFTESQSFQRCFFSLRKPKALPITFSLWGGGGFFFLGWGGVFGGFFFFFFFWGGGGGFFFWGSFGGVFFLVGFFFFFWGGGGVCCFDIHLLFPLKIDSFETFSNFFLTVKKPFTGWGRFPLYNFSPIK